MVVRLATFVLMLVVAAVVIPLIPFASRCVPSIHKQCAIELLTLSDALDQYKARYGELFPNSYSEPLIRHIRKAYPYATDIDCALTRLGCEPENLDDAEILVLFLSGNIEEMLGRPAQPALEFADQRLKDIDKDGWPEYTSNEGEPLRYDGVLPLVYSRSLGVWMTVPARHNGGGG